MASGLFGQYGCGNLSLTSANGGTPLVLGCLVIKIFSSTSSLWICVLAGACCPFAQKVFAKTISRKRVLTLMVIFISYALFVYRFCCKSAVLAYFVYFISSYSSVLSPAFHRLPPVSLLFRHGFLKDQLQRLRQSLFRNTSPSQTLPRSPCCHS